MNALKSLLALIVLVSLTLSASTAVAQEADDYLPADTLLTPQGWIDFGDSISEAIRTGNEGERHAALRHIVRYGRYLDFEGDVVFDVMRIYRDGKEMGPRKLAVVALGNMNNRWAVEFLELSSGYEKSEELLSTINSVVADYRSSHK